MQYLKSFHSLCSCYVTRDLFHKPPHCLHANKAILLEPRLGPKQVNTISVATRVAEIQSMPKVSHTSSVEGRHFRVFMLFILDIRLKLSVHIKHC